jgi:hypothetical protein
MPALRCGDNEIVSRIPVCALDLALFVVSALVAA